AWAQKTPNFGVYDYWANDPVLSQPVLDFFKEIPRRVRYWRANNANSINLESTYSGGAAAFALGVAAQLAWNTKSLDEPLRQQMLDLASGPVSPPTDSAHTEMEQMLARWASGFTLQRNELGLSFQNLSAAIAQTMDPAIRARIADFIAYVHYLTLMLAYQS